MFREGAAIRPSCERGPFFHVLSPWLCGSFPCSAYVMFASLSLMLFPHSLCISLSLYLLLVFPSVSSLSLSIFFFLSLSLSNKRDVHRERETNRQKSCARLPQWAPKTLTAFASFAYVPCFGHICKQFSFAFWHFVRKECLESCKMFALGKAQNCRNVNEAQVVKVWEVHWALLPQ